MVGKPLSFFCFVDASQFTDIQRWSIFRWAHIFGPQGNSLIYLMKFSCFISVNWKFKYLVFPDYLHGIKDVEVQSYNGVSNIGLWILLKPKLHFHCQCSSLELFSHAGGWFYYVWYCYISFNQVINENEAVNKQVLDYALSEDVKSICRTANRVSLTCRSVLKVHKNLFKI